MAGSLLWALLDRNQPGATRIAWSILASMAICVIVAAGLFWKGRGSKGEFFRKEAIAVVAFGWILCGLLGAMPYVISGLLNDQYDGGLGVCAAAVFESVSGFTTTGASIFPSPESLPRAILFWRSLTHWLGGMGIVVLFVAILGQTGSGAKFLFSSEVPGPIAESVRPRIKQTAILLWTIYLGISAIQVVALLIQGVSPFESLCHTFGTMATGGFSTLNGSIGQYHHLGIEITIIVFMLLAGVNFNLYAAIIQGHIKAVLRNKELRVYLLLLVGATALLSADLMLNRPLVYNAAGAIRAAVFQAVSIMTTTGYGTDDFNTWPSFSRWLLVMLMFVGGSAGSTGGGIKVIRIMLFIRVIVLEVERVFRPNVVRPIRIAGHAVNENLRRAVSSYVGLVLVIFLVATMLLMAIHNEVNVGSDKQLDLETAFSAVAATLNNIGPGLGMVGSAENYAFFNAPAKLLLCLLMILGRLEIMVILCLFVPGFYKQN